MSEAMIKALLEERRGYVVRGLADRVKQVDDALKALGFEVDGLEVASVEPRVEKASLKKAAPRRKA